MKILAVTHTFLPAVGGAELGMHEIFQRLGRNHEVYILLPRLEKKHIEKWGVMDSAYESGNYQVIHFSNLWRVPKKLYHFLGGIIPPISLSLVLATFKQIKKINPDIINFHFFIHTGLAITLAKIFTKIPIVLNLTGRNDVLVNMPFFWKFYFKFIIKFTDRIISISKFCLGGAQINKHEVISYGVDIKRFSPEVNGSRVRKKLNISKEKIVLFALQRLSFEKRVDIVIEAMKYIVEENLNTVLIIGGKGEEENKLKALANKLELKDNIIFAGYILEEELPEFFACSDIFVFHSTFETFGLVFPQAFASGKPIVTVNTTAIPEVVEDEITGILVEPLNPEQFAKGVIRLIEDENLRKKLSRKARETAIKKYNWETIASSYEGVFSQINRQRE